MATATTASSASVICDTRPASRVRQLSAAATLVSACRVSEVVRSAMIAA